MRPVTIVLLPVFRITQTGIAGKDRLKFIRIYSNAGIGSCAETRGMMLGDRRYHDDIARDHVERPLADTICGPQQHSDENLLVGGNALRANSGAEFIEAEREVVDSKIR